MQIIAGNAVSPGIAHGPVWIWRPAESSLRPTPVADATQEIKRFELACDAALTQLQALEDKVRTELGDEAAQLFSAHQLMLQDDDFQQEIRETIQQQSINAVWAVNRAGELFAAQMAAMEDAYFQARAADVWDVAGRLIAILNGHPPTALPLPADTAILFAEALSPSETVQLDRQRIAAIVTRQGSPLSHSAILARAMDIPAIMGLETADLAAEWENLDALVDGKAGQVYLSPDSETRKRYHIKPV